MKSHRLAILLVACAGCAQQSRLALPDVTMTSTFKEAALSAPRLGSAKEIGQDWWRGYHDPELDSLQARLLEHSPDLAAALSRYQQARAATDLLRSAQSPTLGTSANVQRDRQAELRPLRGANQPDDYNSATLGFDFQYEVDLWGRIRQQVSAGIADEKAARADLASARLALEAQLADTLFSLRGADEQAAMLQQSLDAYTRANDMIARRYQGGIASGLDQARAQAQLASTRSQLKQVLGQRAVLEHAIAALVGANASSFAVTPMLDPEITPDIPAGIPSALLQRRPDIAAAKLRVSAANARVGVAKDAFFPSLSLGGGGGYQSSDLARIVDMPNIYWAIGPTLALNVLDGGRRKAQVAGAEAVLEQAGQRYRGVVLAALQQVEDQLALIARYGEAARDDGQAADAAGRALDLATKRYQQGAASYLEVVTAQTAHLEALRSSLDLTIRQRRASVQLVRALGGGWSAAQLDDQNG